MPASEQTQAVATIIEDASCSVSDLVEELAEPLAELMLRSYSDEDWQDSPAIEALARVAAMLEAEHRAVPDVILTALRKATEAGRPVGVA